MKIGLLSDIHANAHALAAVLEELRRQSITELLIAGDFIGYYYAADQVLDMLDTWSWQGIRGNHEEMVLDYRAGNGDQIRRKYGSGLSVALEKLSREKLDFLLNLPAAEQWQRGNLNIQMCHGSPWDPDSYIYPDAGPELKTRIAEYCPQVDILVLGHSHYPMHWSLPRNNGRDLVVVNPGSVGQPRDRKGGACYATLCLDSAEVQLERVNYDNRELLRECQTNDPQLSYLQKVLTRRA